MRDLIHRDEKGARAFQVLVSENPFLSAPEGGWREIEGGHRNVCEGFCTPCMAGGQGRGRH